ncbi:hypothetical protein HPP92_019457 [Vanilla planifolia]|uniref:tRNA pseudouridine synthase n=1 Tax=Vanilla planifolia TaxID=51239 RepID=A0A835UKY8_VANPL|nr:hypothetical protein HPP92_019457 [Vanilla planifolia]
MKAIMLGLIDLEYNGFYAIEFKGRDSHSCSNRTFNKTGEELRVMCVELVANRFLRKMVRVLVSTAIREAAAGAGDDALINLMDASCRRATAPPAPPYGLCLVDVGYAEFDRQNLFIL